MMTTFHVIHIIVGAWLVIVNFGNFLTPTALLWNNVILGAIVAVYNVWFLLKGNVDVANKS